MSVRVMADVWDSAMQGSTAVHVMAVLANSADDDGMNCFPGTRLIARRARVSERQVIRTIQKLESDGYLKVMFRGRGARHFSEYHLNVTRLHEEAEKTRIEEREKRCHGVMFSRNRKVTTNQEKGDIGARERDIGDTPLFVLPVLDPSSDPHPKPLAREGRLEIEIGRAVDQVCSALNVANRRRRKALANAVAMRCEKGEEPPTIALAMISAVRDQDREYLAGNLKVKYGLWEFLLGGVWCDRNRWYWNVEQMRLQAEASTGSYR